MGTNYYAEQNCCETCGRGANRLHIGKSSAGWSFSFHAIDEWDSWDDLPVSSYQQWLNWLTRSGVRIVDEYGQKVTLTEFRIMVNGKADGQRHAEYVKTDPHCALRCDPSEHWLDVEGHSFSRGEFS